MYESVLDSYLLHAFDHMEWNFGKVSKAGDSVEFAKVCREIIWNL